MVLKNDWQHPCPISLDNCRRIVFNILTFLFDEKVVDRSLLVSEPSKVASTLLLLLIWVQITPTHSKQVFPQQLVTSLFLHIDRTKFLFTIFLDFKLTKRLSLDVCRID